MGSSVFCFHLAVYIYPVAVLPLGPLYTDPARWLPGAPDAAVGGPHHFDGSTTSNISACPVVGFPPLGGKVDCQAFQRDLFLISQQVVHGDD